MAAIAFSLCPRSPTVNAQWTFETRSRPALARRYPRDFTFYLEIPFLDCSFAITSPNGATGMSDPPSPRLRRANHRRKSDEGRSENGGGGGASNIDGQTERSNGALGKAT